MDEIFLRRIFNVQYTTPKESLFIETGKISVKYIIKMMRVMYWFHIVNLDKKEVLHKFYLAQKLNTSKDDWYEQLEKG